VESRHVSGRLPGPVRPARPALRPGLRADHLPGTAPGGFYAPAPSSRQVTPRTPAEVLALAAALKRENPARTAAQVARVLRASGGWSPSERTLPITLTKRRRRLGIQGTFLRAAGGFLEGEMW
jgi:hypothetical protein